MTANRVGALLGAGKLLKSALDDLKGALVHAAHEFGIEFPQPALGVGLLQLMTEPGIPRDIEGKAPHRPDKGFDNALDNAKILHIVIL